MSSNAIALPSNHQPQAPRIAQATAVEQSRAVAEVQAAVLVAQQCPRDVQAAIAAMRVSCGLMGLAERAFYRYSRGGSQISGPTVHLARELARVWGNIDYGVRELARDDDHGQSEMLAFAWDQETNARNSIAVIVPHARDKKGGPEKLVDLRDIYENNANNAARRLRQTIFAVLPPWFVDEAVELCRATLKRGADAGQKAKPLPTRIADMLVKFAELRVTEDDLVRKLGGRPSSRWTEHDVADLGVIYKSIERGETTRDDEFPPPAVSPEEIAAARPAEPPAPAAPAPEPAPVEPELVDEQLPGDQAPAALVAKVKDQLYRMGVTKVRDQVDTLGRVAGRKYSRLADVSADVYAQATNILVRAGHADEPLRALDALIGELEDARAQDGA